MELDKTSPCLNFTNDFSENKDVQSIENRVQSLTLDNDIAMETMDDSRGVKKLSTKYHKADDDLSKDFMISENEFPDVRPESQILFNSAEAFLQLQKERVDTTFSRTCLFCKKHFTGNRSLLLNHFTEQHNFFMGQPDNLVYINEFLDILEKMLNRLQCLYCSKIFKDWSALKEHMRKKMHKRINSSHSVFDKFYMTNYLNAYDGMDTKYQNVYEIRDQYRQYDDLSVAIDDDREIDVEPKDDSIICLYCECKYFDFDEIMHHLKVLANGCTICDAQFTSKASLVEHMTDSGHIKLLPDKAKWDQSEFFFSTLDTDYLLCGLQDDDDEENYDQDHAVEIISEDIVLPKSSILIDENLRRTLL